MYKSGVPRFVLAMRVDLGFALLRIRLASAMGLALIPNNKELAETELAAVGV